MPAWVPIAAGIAAGADALFGSRENDKNRELSKEELAFRKQMYGDREPLRAMGLARLGAKRPERPDMAGDFADESNPFYKAPSALGFGDGYAGPGQSKGEMALRAQGLSSLVPGATASTPTTLREALRARDLEKQKFREQNPEVMQRFQQDPNQLRIDALKGRV
jgi:hypothetical protein